MYGSGLRRSEVARLRVQDIDFGNACIVVREAKGMKWRRTLLPKVLIDDLKHQIDFALALHQKDSLAAYTILIASAPPILRQPAQISLSFGICQVKHCAPC